MLSRMPAFGENVKRLRERAKLTQEGLAARMGWKRPTPVSLMEGPRKHLVPKASTIKRLAKAVDAEPWELLDGVETDYDKLRRSGGSEDDPSAPTMNSEVGAATRLSQRLVRDAAEGLAAARDELSGILLQLGPTFARISTLRDELTRRQNAVARVERPGPTARGRRARQRPDRRRPPKPTRE